MASRVMSERGVEPKAGRTWLSSMFLYPWIEESLQFIRTCPSIHFSAYFPKGIPSPGTSIRNFLAPIFSSIFLAVLMAAFLDPIFRAFRRPRKLMNTHQSPEPFTFSRTLTPMSGCLRFPAPSPFPGFIIVAGEDRGPVGNVGAGGDAPCGRTREDPLPLGVAEFQ